MPSTSSQTIYAERPTWALPGAAPRFATPRTPGRFTTGPQDAVVARTLGTPFIPWQQYTADVAGELLPDGSYAYEIVIVSVPRQTGKTTLVRSVGTRRALSGRDVFYTAQTGKDARARWNDLVKILRVNPALKDRIKIALRGGSEHVLFPSGGVFQCFAPTPESLHGYTPPTVFVDEAFAQTGGRGELLMGAIGPAQFTIVDRQIWVVSTRGTIESEWFHGLIDQAVDLWTTYLAGGNTEAPRIALFDWGANDDQSPYDLDDIAAFHPGVGFELNGKLLTPGDVLGELSKNTRAEYERAFANRATLTTAHLIPAETWRPLRLDQQPQLQLTDCVVAYDVAHDRQSGAIMALWNEPDGTPAGMILEHRPGTAWMVDALVDYSRRRPRALAAVDSGPVLDLTAQLRMRGIRPDVLGEREYAAASGAFLSRVDDAALRWWADTRDAAQLLEQSVTGLVTRAAAVDGVAFSRRHSAGDSAPAIAYVAGLAVLTRRQLARTGPLVYFGKS